MGLANEILSELKKNCARGGLVTPADSPGSLGFSRGFFFNSEGGSTEAVHSGLARQVSSLLTNHLARATECCGNQAAGNDALQDVLSLLNDLSRYGRVSQGCGRGGFPLERLGCLWVMVFI